MSAPEVVRDAFGVAKLYTEHRPATRAEIIASGYKDPVKPKKYSGKRAGLSAAAGAVPGLVVAGPAGALLGAGAGAAASVGVDRLTWKKRKGAYDKRMSNPISTMRTDEWVKGSKPYVDRFPADGKGYLSKPVKRFSREVGGE